MLRSLAAAPFLLIAAMPAYGAAPDPDALERAGKFEAAEPARRAALAAALVRSGAQGLTTADAEEALAENLYAQGRRTEAEPLYRRALATRLAREGAASPGAARAMLELGALMADAGQAEAALAMVASARAILVEARGADAVEVVRADATRGQLLEALGRWTEAQAVWESALAATARGGQGETFDAAVLLNNLGVNLLIQATEAHRAGTRRPASMTRSLAPVDGPAAERNDSRLMRAEAVLEEAMDLTARLVPADSPDLANVLASLGAVRLARGQRAGAAALLARAQAIRAQQLRPDHPDRIIGQANLARALPPGAQSHALLAQAAQAAVGRIAGHTGFGTGALAELRRFRPVFLALVRSDWELAAR